MNVFVSGGSGFIGSHVCQEFSQEHKIVTLVRDLFPTESPWGKWLSKALSRTTIVLGDMLNLKTLNRIVADYGINTVIHCAAQAIVSTAQKDPVSTFETNVQGTVNLLEACRRCDVQTVYVVSTDKVYGERLRADELDPLVSTGIYETSKVAEDLAAQAYARTYGLKIIIGRACNTYGFDLAKRIIPNTIRNCFKGEPPVIYEGENTVRQYMYVSDHVKAMLHLISRTHEEYPAIFNVGTEDILTQEQVVKRICNYYPLTPRVVKREKPLKEIGSQSLDWTKLKETGWQPKYTFADGIEETTLKYDEYGV